MISRRRLGGLAATMGVAALARPGILRAQQLAPEQVMQVGFPVADTGTLDPHIAVSNADVPIVQQVYEGLLALPHGALDATQLSPGLAERWESSPDRKVWTFHLRRGVRWHGDFGEFSSADVLFSLERVRGTTLGSPFRGTLANIAKAEADGPLTVRITLQHADVGFPALMVNHQAGYVVCKRAVEQGVNLRSRPIGTGPFRFEAHRARERLTLAAHDAYWGGRPVLRQIVYHFMPDNATRELALRSGDIDLTALPARQDAVDRARAQNQIVDLTDVGNLVTIHINMKKPPFNDVRVRRALAHGIDRQNLSDFFGKDIATPQLSVVSAALGGHTTDIPLYAYDVDRAKALLAEAGHPNGFATEVICSSIDLYLPMMQLMQEQWKKIGFTMNLRVVDHPTYHRLIRQDLSPLVAYSAARYPTVAQPYLDQFFHSAAAIGKPTAITNFSHYGNGMPGIDDLLDKARYSTDAAEQNRLWAEAQRRIATEVAALPLYSVKYALARNRRVDLTFTQKNYVFYGFSRTSRLLRA
ncbi:MAG: polyamine ABC transporter substrate-binding protein [Alphaproteobacteria bacterium]|nr:polyamine ABC transporter substrate-binding protein [Alphaproteobacteria bacterium]